MWKRIEACPIKAETPEDDTKEAFLQAYFDGTGSWERRNLETNLTIIGAGLPIWLKDRSLERKSEKRARDAFGYSFTPDVELDSDTHRYVIELKRAAKFEPMALAEVLHHAEWIRRYDADGRPVIPVVISSFNWWLRLAIDSLARDTVRYYEVEVFDLGNDGERLLWLDAPLAPWNLRGSETLPEFLANHQLHWHHVPETGNWFGLKRPSVARPTVIEAPHVQAIDLDKSTEPNKSRWLLWEGSPAENGKAKPPAAPGDPTTPDGCYYLYDPEAPIPEEKKQGPRWLDWASDASARLDGEGFV